MKPDIVGWAATVVLVLTIGRQAWTQWQSESTAGQSKWLFVGQIVASLGFVVYSAMLDNWVFVVSNAFLLVIAVIGQWLYHRNERRERRQT